MAMSMMTYRFYFIFHPVRRASCRMQSFNKKTMSDQLVIFPFNCQSYRTAKSNLNAIVDNCEVDILCLTETFENEREPVRFRQWSKLSKPRKDGYGGVAVLYKDDENGIIMKRKQELERDGVGAICAKITTDKNSFLLVVAYVPPKKRSSLKGYYQFKTTAKITNK